MQSHHNLGSTNGNNKLLSYVKISIFLNAWYLPGIYWNAIGKHDTLRNEYKPSFIGIRNYNDLIREGNINALNNSEIKLVLIQRHLSFFFLF